MKNMFALKIIFTVITSMMIFREYYILAEPIHATDNDDNNVNMNVGDDFNENNLDLCEKQLSKYRRFLLHTILSFEDVCDSYMTQPSQALATKDTSDITYRLLPLNVHETGTSQFLHNAQTSERRSEVWAFFKLLMAQFNDIEFTNVIHDAVIERCRLKSQLQYDQKRNSVVLGKKQRFHSWGGKRAQSYVPTDYSF